MKFLSQKTKQTNKQTNKKQNKQTKEHFVEILYRIKNDCAIHFYSFLFQMCISSTCIYYLYIFATPSYSRELHNFRVDTVSN